MKMKNKFLIVISIFSVAMLLAACGNTNNNSEQQDSNKAEMKTNSSVTPVTGSFTDSRDGKTYKTVVIGTQTWMAENLAYKVKSGCWARNNDVTNVTYGYLYNWETAKTVCPKGWHLPTNAEWTTLTTYLGGENVAGGKLKETGTTHWQSPNTGATNESGFTALPGGCRDSRGTFYNLGSSGLWWCSTESMSGGAWTYGLEYNSSSVFSHDYKSSGLSVRCVRDK